MESKQKSHIDKQLDSLRFENATLIKQNNLLKSFIEYHRQRMEDDQRVHITIRLLIENYDNTLKDTADGK